MDIKKILLYIATSLLGVVIWTTWQKDYSSVGAPRESAPTAVSKNQAGPESFSPSDYAHEARKTPPENIPETTPTQPKNVTGNVITVSTDVLHVKISEKGGDIVSAKLPLYPVSVKQKNIPVEILTNQPAAIYVAQSGVTGVEASQLLYTATSKNYSLAPNQKTLNVELKARTKSGLLIEKTFTFTKGSYAIGQLIKVKNETSKEWKGGFYDQMVHRNTAGSQLFSRSYYGAALSSQKSPYEKLTFKDLSEKNLNRNIEGGWIAIQQPYFLTAWVPKTQTENHYYSRMFGQGDSGEGNTFVLGYVSPEVTLKPGAAAVNQSTLYAGPELEKQLTAVAKGLDLTIDYGWLWFLSKPIFYVMSAIEKMVGNWGWSIILITLLIKIIFYPLSAKSYKSMAKMREIGPRLQALRDHYKDDRQALGKATMELYKREKVNPAGGCLPMLIQIPVFIALYYVLIESVELRQAPFILWIQDLSTKDPYHVLPILMAASMFWQQKLSPPPPDPTQAKMMMFLPVVFLFVFWSFPAGLVLYWLTNNIISILQQWYIMKTYDPKQEKKKKNKKR